MTRVSRKDYNDEDYNELECYDAICSSWGGSLRFKVVYDKQTNGAAPSSVSGFLQWIISTPTITSPMLIVL